MTRPVGVVFAGLWIALAATRAAGQTKVTLSEVTVESPDVTGLYPTDDLRLAWPTVGLFIGVSQYEAKAKAVSTPAHSIAAALMHEAFYDAARESETQERRTLAAFPQPARWARHRGKVKVLAFSPDGTLLASGGEDGAVVLGPWERAGETASLAGGSPVVDLSFSRDGSRLLAAFSNGQTTVWDPRQHEPSIEFQWKGAVHNADLSPDGSHLAVTMDTGEIWLVEARPQAKPVRLQKATGCSPFPRAVFSPDGNWIAGSDCHRIWLWPVNSPGRPLRVGGEYKGFVRNLLFSPLTPRLIAAGDQGVLAWRLPGLAPENLNIPNSYGAVELAVMSSDGRFLATVYEKGRTRVWDMTLLQAAGTMPRLSGHPLAGALGRGGDSFVGLTYSGWAWVTPRSEQAALSVLTRPVSTDAVLAAKMRNAAVIEGLGLPAEVPTEATGAVALTADGQVVAAGYRNGEVALHPGIDRRWNCSAIADRLSLVLDLSLPANDAESSFTMAVLKRLHGTSGDWRLCGPDELFLTDSGYQVGGGGPVNRQRILASLDEQIAAAEALLARDGRVFLVVYIVAHGELTPDGRAWILPADAAAGDATTWIDYDRIADPVRRFLERARASKGADAARALLIFDACQRGGGGANPKTPLAAAPGLVIVESASPGQYAWHWIPEYRRREVLLGKSESGKVSREKTPDTVNEFRTRISILPIASQFVLSKLIEVTGAANDGNDEITVGDWIEGITHMVPRFQRQIPEAGSEFRQDVRVLSWPEEKDWTLFRYYKREFKP